MGVSTATAYRWVSMWGGELLPMAALFGVVRSSGVVGVDEKWVKVPKTCGEHSRTNDKPEGKHKKWMDNKKDKERPPQERIGGKCPLELAGYEVRKLPIAQICRGQLLGWPTEAWKELVPNA